MTRHKHQTARGYWVSSLFMFLAAWLLSFHCQAQTLNTAPLFRMKPADVGKHLAALHSVEPDFRKRVVHLARQNIGQPYELFLLGEFPYETIDPQPMFSLEKSDCVVFAEHTYAMALSKNWQQFFWTLQRLRYKEGVIGVVSRNHYTEADWNPANAWLVKDVTRELAGERIAHYTYTVDREKFFKTRYQLQRNVPAETVKEAYVPKAHAGAVLAGMEAGDMFNVVSRVGGETHVTHVGIIAVAADGSRSLIHSSAPSVREESLDAFVARAEAREARVAKSPVVLGFKFLRLNPAPSVPTALAQPRP